MCRDFTKGAKISISASQSILFPIDDFKSKFNITDRISWNVCHQYVYEFKHKFQYSIIKHKNAFLIGRKIKRIHQSEEKLKRNNIFFGTCGKNPENVFNISLH